MIPSKNSKSIINIKSFFYRKIYFFQIDFFSLSNLHLYTKIIINILLLIIYKLLYYIEKDIIYIQYAILTTILNCNISLNTKIKLRIKY